VLVYGVVVLLVVCNVVVYRWWFLLVAAWGLRMISDIFLENFLGGEKWMTVKLELFLLFS
jgi:hypothetical protein